ncbi:DUF7527 domain-containing protein [Natronorubrum bangense]|uniref:DUF7527 domain-containing protein n=2 Tax=Natronorubrum bangense TaxID=61858 RepID=L9W1L5_9EURY|nr:hypothetical protein [Natronorubrum bangense]ELY43232.1 hypothetical protein C494_19582 [Natronorubrum bangense JCM 10635]QCC53320.1 transcriptional regulator [Natronorubrum bangense]
MNSRTQERVEQWDSQQFDGGYDGLADLAAADFSGAVVAAGTWLFMLNGRIVGVVDGSVSDFETTTGTVYEAPHPSLPLLSAMEEADGDTRAKYYTNETPLHEVDETLQSGSFTGYVELSENVLSGDYYAVYYGGRRMAAAYIGNAEQLLTGDEAFERADNEVGIYEVTDVDIDVTDVPGTDTTEHVDDSSSNHETTPDTEPEPTPSAATTDEPNTEMASEPSSDPTESAIESIDLSETEPTTADEPAGTSVADITLDDTATESPSEETDAQSGITTADGSEPHPASSGITETEVTSELESDSAPTDEDGQTELESETREFVTDLAATTEIDDSSSSDSGAPEHESVSVGDDDEAGTNESAEAVGANTTTVGSDDESVGTDSERGERSSLDPAAVEKAAAQLEQSNISWTEDDVESQSDDEPQADDERFEQEAQWRETRRIPSIDPDNTESAESAKNSASAGRGDTARSSSKSTTTDRADNTSGRTATTAARSETPTSETNRQRHRSEEDTHSQRGSSQQAEQATATTAGSADEQTASSADHERRIATLTQQLETLVEKRDALAARAEELEAERDRLRSENNELSTTVDRLQSRVQKLQSELEQARESASDSETDTPDASTALPAQQALAGTNLFVRYGSKSQPTLETAHDGEADRTEVESNRRLEYHTGFDASDVAVDGAPYEEFLTATMEYRFVDWLTAMVLYEIRDTGNANGLGDLYDAIPRIDRAELEATISLADDDTDDVPDDVTFDIVAFDKMGNPLIVANLNESREPATQAMLEEMEEAASAVKANYPDLAAATVVTSSYFEPGALEVAEQATTGGLLSRSSKLSYVNLSRKQGYHLCLVESRSEGFHMNVPEL